jgi:hypothetical protein
LKELIKSENVIKLLICLIDLFKDLIEEKHLKVNWEKLKELIKFKDLIKLLMSFVDSINDFKKSSLEA